MSPQGLAPAAPPRRWGYLPQLDGLRAIAVYLVVLFHSGSALVDGGFIGVDVFFVLSGFLVTSVLLAEIETTGSFSLRRFYARRVRRLLPAAIVVITLTCLLQLLVAGAQQRSTMIREAQSALVYLSNWQFISEAQDYFAKDLNRSPFLHFWSLSIEEQFYLGFPLLLLLCVKLRLGRRGWATLFGVMGAVSLGLQWWSAQRDPTYAYYATEGRLYQLLAGVLLALWVNQSPRRLPRAGSAAAAVGVVAMIVIASSTADDLSASTRGVMAMVCSVAVIWGLVVAPAAPVSLALASAGPRYLGQISYGTYLWHWPVILWLERVLDVRPLTIAALATLVATGLAALSYELFEDPIRRARVLSGLPLRVVATGLALSFLTALVVVPRIMDSPRSPRLVASKPAPLLMKNQVGWLDDRIPRGLDLIGAAGDVPAEVPMCTEVRPNACRVADGAGQRWLLIG